MDTSLCRMALRLSSSSSIPLRAASSRDLPIGLTGDEVIMASISEGETNRFEALSSIVTDMPVHSSHVRPLSERMDATAKYPQNRAAARAVRQYVTIFLSIFLLEQILYRCYQAVYVPGPECHKYVNIPGGNLFQDFFFLDYSFVFQGAMLVNKA